jgi:hypothetical protein
MSVTTRAIGAPLDLAGGPDKVKGVAIDRRSHPAGALRRSAPLSKQACLACRPAA